MELAQKLCRPYGVVLQLFFRPFRGLVVSRLVPPRLAPWAVFFRRFAATSQSSLG
jgi:hypothetical protein